MINLLAMHVGIAVFFSLGFFAEGYWCVVFKILGFCLFSQSMLLFLLEEIKKNK